MNTENANPALFAALAAAQGEIENATKNAANPHFRSKYADLGEVLTTIRETLPRHGLSLVQSPEFDGATVTVVTLLAHKDGGFITARASCVPAKTDAQGIGAATTYLRRYSAAALAGIAQEDDDGQSASHNRKPRAVEAAAPRGNPLDGVWENASPEQREFITTCAASVCKTFAAKGAEAAARMIYSELKLEPEEVLQLWTQLPSDVRNQSKKFKDAVTAPLADDRSELDQVA